MDVQFTPEQEAQIVRMANRTGTDASQFVKTAALRALEEESRFLAAVDQGLAAAQRGEFIEEAEMDARIERMFKR
jgi:predicted transcriptional regulator